MMSFRLALAATTAGVFAATLTAQTASLRSDTRAVPLPAGGTQNLELDAGTARAGQRYLLLGSLSGTTPGLRIGATAIPLNADPYLLLTASIPAGLFLTNATGTLDASGRASAALSVPAISDPSLFGARFHHAFVTFDGAGNLLTASNAEPAVLARTVTRITSQVDNATLGTRAIDVRGTLGSTFANSQGIRVEVNGVQATLQNDAFEARDVPLNATGNTTLTATATNSAGHVERFRVQVAFVPVQPNNLTLRNGVAYSAIGAGGLAVMQVASREIRTFAPPAGVSSIDDVAHADGLLFALDARSPGNLMVYSLANPRQPSLVAGPVLVPVSPFAGVSAGGGRVVVSGGTSQLTVRSYDSQGRLGSSVASADLGIGQPDVLVSGDGMRAYVSTDFSAMNPRFGITTLQLSSPPTAPTVLHRTGLAGAGFTAGGQGPANFAIESALLGNTLLTAHGGGLALIDTQRGTLIRTVDVGVAGVNVDVSGNRAFVVGSSPARTLTEVDVSNPASARVVNRTTFPGVGAFTGVAADTSHVVIAANGGGLLVVRR